MNWPIKRTHQVVTPRESGLLHHSIDDLLEDFFGSFDVSRTAGNLVPRFGLSETNDEFVIEAELPGLDEKDVQVTVTNDVLRIAGEKKQEQTDKKKNYTLCERSYGRFERAVRLGSGVDAEKVEATFKKGILAIRVPKTEPEQSKARTIEIKAT